MKMLKFISIKLTAFLILGILIGNFFDFNLQFVFYTTLFSILVLGLIFWRTPRNGLPLFGGIAAITIVLIGVLITILAKPINAPNHYSNYPQNKQAVWILKIKEKLKPTAYSNNYYAEAIILNNHKTCGRLLLNHRKDSTIAVYEIDEEVIVTAPLKDIRSPLNPHQFSYKDYLERKGIPHQLTLTNQNHIKKQAKSRTFYGLASNLRNEIINKLKVAGFDKEQLGIIQALFLGQRDDISQTTYKNYKDAGAVHILAVSGLHIGILLLFLQFLLSPIEKLPKGRLLKLLVMVILLWGFAFLAGLSASIVRAVTMFSFVAYAMYLNRPQNTFNILALSMFFILLIYNPLLLFDVGFQMSYAAVFAIVWMYPILQKLWYPKNWFIRKVWQLLSVSIAAQIGVLPISLYYFHQFPGLFFVSNLLVIPFLGLILGLGIIIILLILLDLAPNIVIDFYNSLIGFMNTIINWVAKQEAFIFRNIAFDGIQLTFAYALIFSAVFFLLRPNFKRLAQVFAFIILFQGWHLYTQNKAHQKEVLLVNHRTKTSILSYHKGNKLQIFTTDSSAANNVLTNYRIEERIDKITYESLKNVYTYKNKRIMVLDSTSVYIDKNIPVDYLLLTQSPKVNIERLIDSLQPNLIIADGSNYTSYIERWRKTCAIKKLPFHYTGEKGAYIFEQ